MHSKGGSEQERFIFVSGDRAPGGETAIDQSSGEKYLTVECLTESVAINCVRKKTKKYYLSCIYLFMDMLHHKLKINN